MKASDIARGAKAVEADRIRALVKRVEAARTSHFFEELSPWAAIVAGLIGIAVTSGLIHPPRKD